VKIFDTPGCRNTSRDYSRQYNSRFLLFYLALEEGSGYYFVGVDRTCDPREGVQLSLFENSTARKFNE
jgi:hypothetical protein